MCPPSIVSFTYEHFQFELYAIGFFMQPQKCVAWSPFGLPLDFNTPFQFTTPLEGIRVLGVPFSTTSFASTFIKNALVKDIQHVNLLPIMGDVQVAFRIPTHYFMQRLSYFL
jgi:hypothetical protein